MKKLPLILTSVLIAGLSAAGQRIAVLNDTHVTPGAEADSALRVAVEQINAEQYDAVVVNGDLTNEGSDLQLTNIDRILRDIRHPLYVLPGNHEDNWSQSATHTFPRIWGNDRFAAKIGQTVIVGVNCGPYMKMGDGHIKQEDLHWLSDTLTALCTPGTRVLSFNHYPVRKDDLDNYIEYAGVLSRFPVVAHINGHYHRNIRYDIAGLPGVMLRSFIPAKTPGYLYSIVELTPDSLLFYEKNLDQAAPRRLYSLSGAPAAMNDPDSVYRAGTPAAPEGFSVRNVFTDKASIFTRLAFDKDAVYAANSLGQLLKIDKTTGRPVWTIPTGATIFSRPVVLPGGKVAFPYHAGIFVVDAGKGVIADTLATDPGTPYVADGLIAADRYLQGGYCRFEARNPLTGKIIWSYDSIGNYCQAAPAVCGDNVVFGAWDTNLRCLDLATGDLRWQWNNGKKANMLGPGNVVPVITAGRVYIVAPDRFMTALSLADGSQLWRNKDHRYRESLGVSPDGKRVYAKTMDGELAVIDATVPEFKELALVDLHLGYEHAPCIVAEADGIIYTGSRRGIITATDAATLGFIGQIPVGVSEINAIDIDPTDGSVWASLIEGKIVRIDKRAGAEK